MSEHWNIHRKLIAGLVVLMLSCGFGLSYFMRPHENRVELVTLEQELPDPNKKYPLDLGLAERITKSYGLALVLVISEYSQRNAIALDGIRGWARKGYQRDASFLHNSTSEEPDVPHLSIVESFCYSLFSAPRNALRDSLMENMKQQIDDFHSTKAYKHFSKDYFDSFGLDRESALLLARYQSEKGRVAVNVLMSLIFWTAIFIAGMIFAWHTTNGASSSRFQRVFSLFWLVLAAYYLNVAWSQNQVMLLISSLVCGAIGGYIRKPFVVVLGEDRSGVSFRLIKLQRPLLALLFWCTISLISIQIMTWIKTGTLIDPDPLSLFISSCSGNFLYDPTSAKRSITHAVGIVWLIVSAFVFREVTIGVPSIEITQEFASFDKVAP